MSFQSIRENLAADLAESTSVKSSHWKFHTASMNVSSDFRITGINGFSNRTRRFPGSSILHRRNLIKLFPWAQATILSSTFDTALKICHMQNREIDTCVVRHVLTLELLGEFSIVNKSRTCVIGDGQSNFVSLAISNNFADKLISVNLTEVLLSDLELIEKLPQLSSEEIVVARNNEEVINFLKNPQQKLLLISAQNATALQGSDIDLFINIASFQEMTPNLVSEYFKIIASNKAFLYCCNRLEKHLYGGEINRFFDFPWGDAKVILDESCRWHQEFYNLRSITLYKKMKFDGEIWHRLVKF